MAQVGAAALPVMVGLILLFGFAKGVPVFDVFLTGAKDGLRTTLNLLPTLIGLIAAVTMLRASGLLDALCTLLQPVASAVGISPELLPLALLRPISGSGASAYTLDLFRQFGPDSETGRIASVLSSSTETTFYAIAVYFGSCGYKRLGYTIPAALMGDLTALVCSIFTVKFLG
ncbi:MAG: spore maturation protein [Acutalibacter sp.]